MADSEKLDRLIKRRFDLPSPSCIVPLQERISSLANQQIETSNEKLRKKSLDLRKTSGSHGSFDCSSPEKAPPPAGRHSIAADRINLFNQQAEVTKSQLEKNPFSETYKIKKFDTSRLDYGRPEKGSLTESRGIAAGNNVSREILELCQVINDCGYERPDGTKIIKFGQLFNLYTRISDKVVGMLLRARKHGLVDFDGEMLYQRQDEEKIIILLKTMQEINSSFTESNDPAKCLTSTT